MDYEKVVKRACLHGGDSDTTGTIAMAWYGALYGTTHVHELNLRNVEKKKALSSLADALLQQLPHPTPPNK